ncbi:MAG: hypothetical protein VXY91_00655 [Bacteroidota bacterium]|nr:hypothetical protein [Bacteroidota bacterium]
MVTITTKSIKKYLVDFSAIFLGVTASFALSEMSERRAIRKNEAKIIADLKTEVSLINEYTDKSVKILKEDILLYEQLLKNESVSMGSISSKTRVESALFNFTPFTPPMETYQSIIGSDGLRILNSNQLKIALNTLYSKNYNRLLLVVDDEKQLKYKLLMVFLERYPEIVTSRANVSTSLSQYVSLLESIIDSDQEVKAEIIIQLKYLKQRLATLQLYKLATEDLENILD